MALGPAHGALALLCPLPPRHCASAAAPSWPRPPRSIQVNCLLPGAINTPFLDTIVNTDDKLAYLLNRLPAGGWVGGHHIMLWVVGGWLAGWLGRPRPALQAPQPPPHVLLLSPHLMRPLAWCALTQPGCGAGRLGVSQDVVGPAVFLASSASNYVTGGCVG